MDGILEKAAVRRFKEASDSLGVKGEINILAETARTAIDAANGLLKISGSAVQGLSVALICSM